MANSNSNVKSKKMKKMKKFLFSLGLITMVLNLTNCAQFEDKTTITGPKGDFELFAPTARTANNGQCTIWSAEDQISVIHAEAGTDNYVADAAFTLQDVSTGRFLGSLNGELTAEAYDWYAVYPYDELLTSPNTNRYFTIGSDSKSEPKFTQTQYGNSSKAHLAGQNLPIVGAAKAVEAGIEPALTMKNVAAVLNFNVKNTLDEPITISNIKFTAPTDIVGTFYMDFTDMEDISVRSSGIGYTKPTATLAVTDGEAIAAGESANFYMAVAPFVAAANSTFELEVAATINGGEYIYSKPSTLKADKAYASGVEYRIPVNYTANLSTENINEVIDFTQQGYANEQEITTFSSEYCNISFSKGSNSRYTPKYYDSGTAIRCYGGNTITISSALDIAKIEFTFSDSETDKNAITAEPKAFANDTWAGSAKSVTFTIDGTSGNRRIQKITITYGEPEPIIIAHNSYEVSFDTTGATLYYTLVALEGTVTASADKSWVTAIDCDTEGEVILSLEENSSYSSRTANVTLSKSGAESVTVKVKQSARPKPVITVTSPLRVGGQDTSATIEYSISNPAGAVSATTDADWITAIDCNTEGKINLTLTPNQSSEERSATVTISSKDAEDKEVTVIQAAAGGSTSTTPMYVKVTSTANITDGKYLIVYETNSWVFNGGLTTLDVAGNYQEVTITNGAIEANETTNAMAFTYNLAEKTLRSESGYYIGRTSTSNGFNSDATKKYENTIEISGDGTAIISSAGTTLRFNKTSNQVRFRYYTSGQQPICLYKLVGGE